MDVILGKKAEKSKSTKKQTAKEEAQPKKKAEATQHRRRVLPGAGVDPRHGIYELVVKQREREKLQANQEATAVREEPQDGQQEKGLKAETVSQRVAATAREPPSLPAQTGQQ